VEWQKYMQGRFTQGNRGRISKFSGSTGGQGSVYMNEINCCSEVVKKIRLHI
jgi:hypothetical protein